MTLLEAVRATAPYGHDGLDLIGAELSAAEVEARRLGALADYAILDTGPEACYDDIALIASQICGTPIALISLVDANRQWFKARQGMERTETPRDDAFCAHTILSPETFIVPDAQADPRFVNNPLVTGAPFIRFYAGAPLITPSGHEVGALCVIDRAPRQLSAEQIAALEALSRQVVALLELRRVSSQLAHALGLARTLGQLLPICSYCKQIRDDRHYWQRVESYITEQLGASFSHGICPACEDLHFPTRTPSMVTTLTESPALAEHGSLEPAAP